MTAIPGARLDITGASGSQGLLAPRESWKTYVFPRGGYASQDSSGQTITFDSAGVASRFAANNWLQVGLDTSKIRQVDAVGGNSLTVKTSAVAVSKNDRIFLIGNTQPTVVGGSASYITPQTLIYQRDDDGSDLYSNSMVTTDANGVVQFYAPPTIYDCLIQDGDQSAQGFVANLPVGVAEGVSTANAAVFGATATFNGQVIFNDVIGSTLTVNGPLGVTGTAVFEDAVTCLVGVSMNTTLVIGETLSCLMGVSVAESLHVAYDTISGASGTAWIASRFGGRAQITGDNRSLIYASETYDQPLIGNNDETTAVYGINQITNATSGGADAQGLQGEVQFSPTTAVTAAASINGANFTSRYGGTHASAVSVLHRGAFSRFITSVGSTGTVTSARGLEVGQGTNQGTVEITNYIGLYVNGCSSGFATTINQVANFVGPTDEGCDFIISRCPVRIDDNDNQGNAAAAGRWVDIYRDWDGGDAGSPLYAGVHLTLNLEGASFTTGDDAYGFRSVTRTGSAAGDGALLDTVAGFQSVTQHRSDQTVDELYGYVADVTMSGSSQVNTMAGFDCRLTVSGGTATNVYSAIFRSLAPAATLGSAGHLRLVPVSTATPATDLGNLTAAEDGTIIYITDSDNNDNSGFYFRVNGVWKSLTEDNLTFRPASDTT
jgi:hypothetical protein